MAKKLLLADDSITIQKVIGITFANEDYELTVVDNGADCVAKAKEIRPDLILADVVMPEKDGYQVCVEIKNDSDLAGIPIILLTGTFESFDEARSKEVGADDYITKPFESQTLIDKVKSYLKEGVSPEAPAPEPQAEAGGVAVEAPTEEQPVEAPAEPEAMAVEEEVVELSEDEIWDVSEEAAVVDVTGAGGEPIAATEVPEEAVAESSVKAADEWSIDEFEEVATEVEEMPDEGAVSEGKAEEAISDEELWGGMEFGEIEEAPQAESELSEVAADTAESSLVEDEFAEFGGAEEVSEEVAQDLEGGEFSEFEDVTADSMEEVSAPEISPVAASLNEEQLEDLSAAAEGQAEPLAAHISPDSTDTPPVSEVVEAAEAVEPPAQEIPQEQLEAVVSKVAKEVVEKIAWEIVPELAETLIMEEIKKLKAKIGG